MLPPAVTFALLSRRLSVFSFTMLGVNLAVILVLFAKLAVSDNLALLLGTLRTYQRTGCDRDIVTLKCPHGTTISVQLANYGKVSSDQRICPTAAATNSNRNTSCMLPQVVQIVVEACQKKRQCKFEASPKTVNRDPCPGVGKHVEVTYKCRPYEFRSKVACENDVVQLTCNPNSRIAVYSASFGRTEYESVQCPQPQGVPEETCLVSYATETVMHICHGKRRCKIGADVATFGKPCRPTSRMYLKIVYTCVPRKVVLETIEEPSLDDESTIGASRDVADYDELDAYDMDDIFRESAFSPKPGVVEKGLVVNLTRTTTSTPLAKDQTAGVKKIYTLKKIAGHSLSTTKPTASVQQDGDINCTVTFYSTTKPRVIGFISEWINAYSFLKKNQEKMYLYLIVSITSGLLVFLIIVIARLMVHKYRAVREVKMYSSHHDHTIPHEFGDENSEIDADITLATTPTALPQISTLGGSTYRSNTGTCRSPEGALPVHQSSIDIIPFREVSDTSQVEVPRSLNRYGNSQYYFG